MAHSTGINWWYVCLSCLPLSIHAKDLWFNFAADHVLCSTSDASGDVVIYLHWNGTEIILNKQQSKQSACTDFSSIITLKVTHICSPCINVTFFLISFECWVKSFCYTFAVESSTSWEILFGKSNFCHTSSWFQARLYHDESLRIGSLISSQVSVELKRARSLVRVEEIQATLHEQRYEF